MRARLSTALVGACLVALALAPSAHATFPGANGKIAFLSPAYMGCIYTVNPDGTGKALDAPCSLNRQTDLAWGPDGRKLAYIESNIYVFDGANASLVYNCSGCGGLGLAWSPDGSKLVSASNPCSHDEGCPRTFLFTVHADGTGATEVKEGGAREFYGADWSPDGSKIAFYTLFQGIETIAPDGTGRTTVTASGSNPSWSPDGAKIAFERGGDVWVINADGTGELKLTHDAGKNDDPVWSPDGTKIAFTSWRDDPNPATCLPYCRFDIYVMNADGSGQTNITQTPTDREHYPTWQPLPGPQRGDYKNAAKFCKVERAFLGEQRFRQRYGTGPKGTNAYGKCVSGQQR